MVARVMSILRPPPPMTISEWADAYRYLSAKTANRPGKWRTDVVPYLREVMDAFKAPDCDEIVVMAAARTGKTSAMENAIGYVIHHDPCLLFAVFPNEDDGDKFARQHIEAMVDESPALRGKIIQASGKEAGSTSKVKVFQGGLLQLGSANAAASLAGRTAKWVLADEVDRYPADVDGEGDPLALAKKRVADRPPGFKIYMASTPTGGGGASRIAREFARSDQRRWFVPCPHCGHEQHLVMRQVVWDKEEAEDGTVIRHLPETARYVCEACGEGWDDVERVRAVRNGRWKATATPRTPRRRGYHLTALVSPFVSLSQIAAEWLEAQESRETLRTFVNTVEGLPFEDRGSGEEMTVQALLERREQYDAEVPTGAAVLTMGVDSQGDRMEYEIVGWGAGEESWSIEVGVVPHSPLSPDAWLALDEIAQRPRRRRDGTVAPVSAVVIDTGGNADGVSWQTRVADECRKRQARRWFPVFGAADKTRRLMPVWPGTTAQTGRRAGRIYPVGSQQAKEDALGAIHNVRTPGPRYAHFPVDLPEAWAEGLLNEVRRWDKRAGGFRWKPQHSKVRTEPADCRAYAYAAWRALFQTMRVAVDAALRAEALRIARAADLPPVERQAPARVSTAAIPDTREAAAKASSPAPQVGRRATARRPARFRAPGAW
jgi:phage terminase large subunit GpA-like protein